MGQPIPDPRTLFGQTDIYVIDQLLRGRIAPGMRVFDAGCGGGRNLAYFLRAGYDVGGSDRDPTAVEALRRLARELAPRVAADAFRAEPLESSTEPAGSADVVLCNAVLHFAEDEEHFRAMFESAWKIVRPGGMFFARLASSIGIEERIRPLGNRRFALPDGTQRFLVDESFLEAAAASVGGELLDPLKTTNVQNLRCMTTWVLARPA